MSCSLFNQCFILGLYFNRGECNSNLNVADIFLDPFKFLVCVMWISLIYHLFSICTKCLEKCAIRKRRNSCADTTPKPRLLLTQPEGSLYHIQLFFSSLIIIAKLYMVCLQNIGSQSSFHEILIWTGILLLLSPKIVSTNQEFEKPSVSILTVLGPVRNQLL